MRRTGFFALLLLMLLTAGRATLPAQDDPALLATYRTAALRGGDAARGKQLFEAKQLACRNCHGVASQERLAGPDLAVIGDKLTPEQLIQAVLEPSAGIHPDYATLIVTTREGKQITGVLRQRTAGALLLFDAAGKSLSIPAADVEAEQRSPVSLMPASLFKTVEPAQFADLIAYLATLRQAAGQDVAGLPAVIPQLARPVQLVPLHPESSRFDHPVWIIAKPGSSQTFLVVEQQTRKIWQVVEKEQGISRTLFADLSHEAITGQFEGVMCLAFHPEFLQNHKYYVNYHVREGGVFSPVIAERLATEDHARDRGGTSRRLLRIPQTTDLHWGGMLAFGPDGYLYIGAGDGGPQEDPDGHGQDLKTHQGKVLRIDVNQADAMRPYGIPESNPFARAGEAALPEIWAYGLRMPWRFSWDAETQDLWVADIGQNLFEEVSIVRRGENLGWNVYEGFSPFSQQYQRAGEHYTPPIFSYRRNQGVSITGGYVYRGRRNPSFVGAYIFGDFESKRLWALTQSARKLVQVRQIGVCPEQPASFGVDADGELFVVGYQGTIYRLVLDEAVFE